MKTKLSALAAALLLCVGQSAFAAPAAASPLAGVPVLGGLLAGLTSVPALPVGGTAAAPGLGTLGTINGGLLPPLPLGTLVAPLAGLPVVGPMAVVGADNLGRSVPSLVNLLVNVVVNLPGLTGSLTTLIPAGGALPGLSPTALGDLPTTLSAASTDLLQALNSASAQYGLPALPTALPGL